MWTLPQPRPTRGSAWSRMRPNGFAAEQRAARGVGAAVAAADVEHPAVRRDHEAVRLAAGGEARSSRARRRRAAALVVRVDRRLAVGARHAGGPLDRAEQVRPDLRPRRSSPRSGPCRCRRSGRPGSRGTRRSGDRCRRRRCRRRPARSARGSGRRCGRCPSGASASGTRRRSGSSISGRSRVAGCTRSPATTVCSVVAPGLAAIGPRADQAVEERRRRARPRRSVPMPTKPPPFSMKSCSARLLGGVEPVARGVEEHARRRGRPRSSAVKSARGRRRRRPRSRSPRRAPGWRRRRRRWSAFARPVEDEHARSRGPAPARRRRRRGRSRARGRRTRGARAPCGSALPSPVAGRWTSRIPMPPRTMTSPVSPTAMSLSVGARQRPPSRATHGCAVVCLAGRAGHPQHERRRDRAPRSRERALDLAARLERHRRAALVPAADRAPGEHAAARARAAARRRGSPSG